MLASCINPSWEYIDEACTVLDSWGGGSGQLYLGHHPLENFSGYMHVLLKLKNQVKMSLPYPVHFRMAQNK